MNAMSFLRYLGLSLILFGTVISSSTGGETPKPYGILPASILTKPTLIATERVNIRGYWLGLVCAEAECILRPVNLKFDGSTDVSGGQTLVSSLPANASRLKGEFTIALFSAPFRMQSRSVPTWYTRRTARTPDDVVNGSLGITIRASDSTEYHLVPRWNTGAGTLIIYIETHTHRQRIAQIRPEAVSAGVKTRDILAWAGDIDDDGKIDLITRVDNASTMGGLHLWLSSYAKKGELVGLAATLDAWSDVEEEG